MSTIPQRALEWALKKVGCAYSQSKRWNTNPEIFDCSSLIYRAYQAAGYTFKSGSTSNTEVSDINFNLIWPASRSVLGQSFTSIKTLKAQGYVPQPGDIIYINTNSGTTRANKITHVVMVKDANTIVHARGTAYGVRTDSIDLYGEKIVAVTRWHENSADELIASTVVSSLLASAVCAGNCVYVRSTAEQKEGNIITALDKNHPMVTIKGSKEWAPVVTMGTDGKVYAGYMHTDFIDIIPKG